jgi:hypothetical protein
MLRTRIPDESLKIKFERRALEMENTSINIDESSLLKTMWIKTVGCKIKKNKSHDI